MKRARVYTLCFKLNVEHLLTLSEMLLFFRLYICIVGVNCSIFKGIFNVLFIQIGGPDMINPPQYNAVQNYHDLYITQFVFLYRLYGDEICWRDAADVWSILHSKVFWWGQAVLGSLLRVRQDHAQGKDNFLLSKFFLSFVGSVVRLGSSDILCGAI